MSLLKNIDEETFKIFVRESISKSEVIKRCGLHAAGSNYRAFDILVKKWNVDVSHFSGQSHLKNKNHSWAKKIPLDQILIEGSLYQSSKLRIRLLKEGFLKERCNSCKRDTWLEKKIPLELEHKNGNKFDNRIENLELLCPNCHAFTLTYRGRNKKYKPA